MLCPKCISENQEDANFCFHCGTPLGGRKPRKGWKGRSIALVTGVLICFAVLGYFFPDIFLPTTGKGGTRVKETTPGSLTQKARPPEKKNGATGSLVDKGAENREISKLPPLPVGRVIIRNRWGGEISNAPAAVVNGALIALPTQAVVGGDRWVFRAAQGGESTIGEGTWRDGDRVSLWFLEGSQRFEGPELYPWDASAALQWTSFESGSRPQPVEVTPVREEGNFVLCSFPKQLESPGVFIQNNRVVGWTFGSWLEGGFLWQGPQGKYLDSEISVENFYIITFANGREEQFDRALAMGGDNPAVDRLEAYAEGFLLSPKLSRPKENPVYFRQESVIKKMRSLVAQLVDEGSARRVADILDQHILTEAADPFLLMDVILATSKSYGYESALQLLESVGEYVKRDYGGEVPELDRLHVQLYKSWIMNLMKNGSLRIGWQAFEMGREHFSEDPELHLLGVQLALTDDDWEEAEKLLYMRSYPQSLVDRASVLGTRVSELKGQEEKIELRFTPGSGRIPVTAVLNGSIEQRFVLDTGASTVTVPYSTIRALGIRIGPNNPRRKTSTAGGMVVAPEVVLSSIEIAGWDTRNVRALVLDIPSQPGLGLLGLNYLRRFQMEINNNEGVVLLKPR